jgi:two-component system CheB/CheR fusion protein
MLSHELRNPLGAVVSATALLKASASEESDAKESASASSPVATTKLLDLIERQAQQMARLLDDLLEASRVTQDKIELRRRVLDLGAVLRDAADVVGSLMKRRGVALETDIASEPIWVDGDPARLQQVHVNLLNNAAKYTQRGGHVKLEAKRVDGHAVVRVCDDGAGIPKDMLESAFDLFVQSTRTLDRSEGGLGVGLTLVRGLVAKHGGTVTAKSEGEGHGSEYEVILTTAAAPTSPVVVPAARTLSLPPGSRIVIVEDNADSREMLCTLLTRAGFECHSSDHGLAGLEMIEKVLPHVAIVDIGLPGIDGLEFARRVRKNPKLANVYLIALTGYGQREDREHALAAGFDEHLVKPLDFITLKTLLAHGGSATLSS